MKKIAVLFGYGINCDRETTLAFKVASEQLNLSRDLQIHRLHINQLIRSDVNLDSFSALTIPGGFLHGDDISAGKILAAKLKTHLDDQIRSFVEKGKLLLGICNGFQVLLKYPLIPDLGSERKYTLGENRSGRFIDRWVNVKVNAGSCPAFLRGIDHLHLPIRHAEGRFEAKEAHLQELRENDQIAMQYVDPEGSLANGSFPHNPNGSKDDIAGICDSSGRIFGLMPHPEAFVHPLQEPDWQKRKRDGKMTTENNGLAIFKNVLKFVAEENFD